MEKEREAPAVDHDVMNTPDKLVDIVSDPEKSQPRQGRLVGERMIADDPRRDSPLSRSSCWEIVSSLQS